ncbi:MAG: hypothetical protein IKE70_00835 [Bacilli bacterium]|nr:hypothetical protein [Bacilli bacterium]
MNNSNNKIDLEQIQESIKSISLMEDSLNTKDFTTYFIDLEKIIQTINFEHGNCISNYKEEIDLILETLVHIREEVTNLNNSMTKTIASFSNDKNIDSTKENIIKELFPNTTTSLKLNQLDISNQNIQKVPLPTQPEKNTNPSVIPSVLGIVGTAVATSAGAIYLSNNKPKKKIEKIEEASPILEKAEVNDTNDEDFHENMEFKRYRADRNPENFNKYYDK